MHAKAQKVRWPPGDQSVVFSQFDCFFSGSKRSPLPTLMWAKTSLSEL